MNIKKIIVSIFILVSLAFAGCTQNQDTDDTPTDNASIAATSIQITDAPVDDFSHVNITFSMVKIHSNETGWENITIDEENQTVDLLKLHLNNITDSLTEINLQTGNYTKLWIVIDEATGTLIGDTESINLTVPSGTLKIQQLFNLLEGDNAITLEIDLNASIHSYKGGEAYKILPVLGGIRHEHNNKVQFREKDKNKLQNKVENRKPVVTILVNDNIVHQLNAEINETLLFDAAETFDAENDDLTFFWNFSDGITDENQTVEHNFTEKGTYQVTLTVRETGEEGLEETEKIIVKVRDENKGNGNGNGPN